MQGNNDIASVTFMSYNPTGLDSSMKCRFTNSICEELDVDFLSRTYEVLTNILKRKFRITISLSYQHTDLLGKRLVEQRLG